ncbi:S8 family peptidase [Micromonospora peucetia]|uniref:Peptidase inhibitor I9 n=1 Tax=Micromonospora peucetia TaxID=47871 RepID=A0A1C6W4A6_9ACTN|nr:S8 family peptidase [Micromonospora peucetia]MCX4390211.1 S8 family peptidase [Micromonospora peucetia]WSA32479.1 S8 family peptidase [Micromonospora peucetia]SCL73346.1 Peptidase inhibitor I9 [Micromonospora peucetia]
MTFPRTHRRTLAAAASVFASAAMVTTMIGAPAAASATGEILSAGGATAVADSYIVVLKDTSVGGSAGTRQGEVKSTAGSLAARFGGSVGHVYGDALNGFEVKLSERAAKRLAAHPDVDYVEQNHSVSTMATQNNPPWGLDRIDQRALPLSRSYTYNSTGANVTAYIIDTGIRTSHADFAGQAVDGYDAIDNALPAADCNGHGTHVAGTVGGNTYGVAKNVQLVAVRVLNCQGSGTWAQVIAGINWVTSNHQAGQPAVANMSLGGSTNTALNTAVANSIADGISYAVASGNSNANACNFSPASVPTALTVNASQNNDARASFSNWGTCTDMFAPGVGVLSAWHTSNTATNSISGTSMAAPHVAGAAARVLSVNPGWTPAQVHSYLVGQATPNVITSPGTGSPNRLLYLAPTF